MPRVITPFGFGVVEVMPAEGSSANVLLDELYLDRHNHVLSSKEIFAFGDWATLRIINLGSHLVTNCLFWERSFLAELYLHIPTPPDETVLVLNLQAGFFQANHALMPMAEQGIWVKTWVDRWGMEHSADLAFSFASPGEQRQAFAVAREQYCGTSGGIAAHMLLRPTDLLIGKIDWLYLMAAPPTGVFFERKYFLLSNPN